VVGQLVTAAHGPRTSSRETSPRLSESGTGNGLRRALIKPGRASQPEAARRQEQIVGVYSYRGCMQRSLFVHIHLEKARRRLALGTWDQFCRKVIVDARLRAHEVEIGLARARLEGKGVCV
jgi:hypothetical protein